MSLQDRAIGALYGGAVALVAGVLLPVPEEVATVPTGVVIGAIAGAKRIEKSLPF